MNGAVGYKGQGNSGYPKVCVVRHSARSTTRSANAVEKDIESGVRQRGKRECREIEET